MSSFNTSYVAVEPKFYDNALLKKARFNTSYVAVELNLFKNPVKKFSVSIHLMLRLNRNPLRKLVFKQLGFNTSYVAVEPTMLS